MVGPNDDPTLAEEEATFEERSTAIWERLGEAGWNLGGGDNDVTETINIGFGLPENLREQNEAAFSRVPMWNDAGDLLPGFGLAIDEDTGVATVGYEGPIDAAFEQVVEVMVQLAQPPQDEHFPGNTTRGELPHDPDHERFNAPN